MYWYISFLRPPPLSLSPGQPLQFAVQIANDLRTQPYSPSTPLPLLYAFLLHPPSQPSAHPTTLFHLGCLTPPQKLTLYRGPQDAYRVLSVPLPKPLKPSAVVTLAVWAEGAELLSLLSGRGMEGHGPEERRPLAVFSMPILVSGNGKQDGKGKQGRIQRGYRMPDGPKVGEEEGEGRAKRFLSLVEDTSFDLDKKLWDSGLAFSHLLTTLLFPPSPLAPSSFKPYAPLLSLFSNSSRPLKIVELGTGTGILSLTLAVLLSFLSPSTPHTLYATDLPSALPLLTQNIALNAPLFPLPLRLLPLALDWSAPPPLAVLSSRPDLVLAADVAYNTASFPILLSTLCTLLQPAPSESEVRRGPLGVVAYKWRDEGERDLWGLGGERGLEWELAGKIGEGGEGRETEVWFVRWRGGEEEEEGK